MEYLFRGKTTPKEGNCEFNNTWVYGDLIHNKEKMYIHPTRNAFMTDGELSRLMVTHEVVPETVGMYTGFLDMHYQKIFEGDICVVHNFQDFTTERFIVKYEEPTTRFFLSRYDDVETGDLIDFEHLNSSNVEIIGSISEPPYMRKFRGKIRTDVDGSECEFEFEVEVGTPKKEIEELAKEAAFNYIDWWYDEVRE